MDPKDLAELLLELADHLPGSILDDGPVEHSFAVVRDGAWAGTISWGGGPPHLAIFDRPVQRLTQPWRRCGWCSAPYDGPAPHDLIECRRRIDEDAGQP